MKQQCKHEEKLKQHKQPDQINKTKKRTPEKTKTKIGPTNQKNPETYITQNKKQTIHTKRRQQSNNRRNIRKLENTEKPSKQTKT